MKEKVGTKEEQDQRAHACLRNMFADGHISIAFDRKENSTEV
jgi:hypothetical protein